VSQAPRVFFRSGGPMLRTGGAPQNLDFVENTGPKDRCRDLYGLINRAFTRHWILHDALRHWKKTERVPLKAVLHEIREATNGVHAHLFEKGLATARTVKNVSSAVHAMYSFIEAKNARNFMKHLHERGEISSGEYRTRGAWRGDNRLTEREANRVVLRSVF
jgi:hypothetical protein